MYCRKCEREVSNRPELLSIPNSSAILQSLVNGTLKVFPVAVCFSSFPSTFEVNDVYQFAKQFGIVEKVSEMKSDQRDVSLESNAEETKEEGEEDCILRYRVKYRERYNILLVLQNRFKLVVEGRVIGAEPLFVW